MAGSILEKTSSERERDRERGREAEREPSRRPDDIYGGGPFSLMRRFSEDVDRFFGNTFGATLNRGGHPGAWTPAVDVRQREGNIEVIAELPGMRREDVRVEWSDDGLILEGEKREERDETQGGIRRSERSYGRFYRVIPLPAGADPEKATADFRDGLLQVRIPVQENRQRRRSIPIQTEPRP